MNKEQEELLDEVYENYSKEYEKDNSIGMCLLVARMDGKKTYRKPNKEMFVGLCTYDKTFSKKWGLKIEERELSEEEKEWQLEKTNCINDIENDRIIYGHEWEKYIQEQYEGIQSTQGIKIPTKLITITYNDKTIESYE
jgi:hypothetical protein